MGTLHHYITKYTEKGIRYAESWLQINLPFGRCICFSRKRIKIQEPPHT
nr:MAG TPA: hypothetical protein [Caudoviricetes sp.]